MNGLSVNTLGLAGCKNLSININNGAYETKNRSVTVYLNADDCDQMRISENYNLENAPWTSYSQTYSHSFTNTSNGIKRLYVQFKSKTGTLSPIESDSIVYTSTGYLGIWINDGESITNKNTVKLTPVFPGATQMIISEDSSFSNAFWEMYTISKTWKLSSDEGLKTIYCKFKGGKADPEEVFTSSILYSTTPPKVDIIINNGVTAVATTSVELQFLYSSAPTHMKISNDSEPDSSQEWVTFKKSLSWSLSSGDGEKTVYAVFKDSAGNEYGPVTSAITLDTVAPTGNVISVKETDDSSSSDITTVLVDNLPAFLHFTVSDESTSKAYYYIGIATNTQPDMSEYAIVDEPFNPVELTSSLISQGDNKIWVKFSDDAGNISAAQTIILAVEGPEITLSPAKATLTAGQGQQFTPVFKNIESSEAGNIRWAVASGSGTIDSDGMYVAPDIIYQQENVTIKAYSSSIANLSSKASIVLQPSVQLAYLQTNGEYNIESLFKQISPGETAIFNIYTIGSDRGIKLTSNPSIGSVSLSDSVATPYGSIATITYYAPSDLTEVVTVEVGFCTNVSASVIGKIRCMVSDGANIILTPSAYTAQRNNPITVKAEISNTSSNSVNWSISPSSAGSFSPTTTELTKITQANHTVTFYASIPSKITQASITAEIDGASKSVNISVSPPLSFAITPKTADAMPIAENMLFSVEGFDYMVSGGDESLTWEFRNANRSDFMPADGKSYSDRGSLTILSNNQVQYRRPSKLPSSLDETASDTILIRATSVLDPLASDTATVILADKVRVKIYDNVEKTNEVATAATVIEVGSLQFYATVTPEVIGNTSVAWTVNGVSQSDSYGSIDATGKYTAPNAMDSNKVTIKATSNYDTTAYAEVEVTLSDFWVPKRDNMVDKLTGEPMPITKVFVNPTTKTGDDFIVYAGTGAESQFGYYGLWVATFSDEIGNTSGGYWKGIGGLSSPTRVSDLSLLIYDIALDMKGNIYASTGNGIYYIPKYGVEADAELLTGVSFPPEPLTSLTTAYNSSTEHVQLLAGCNDGVYLFELSDYKTILSKELLIRTQQNYRVQETRTESRSYMVGTETTTIPITETAYSNPATPNPILSTVRSVLYDNLNKSLYFGTASGKVYYCPSLAPNMEYKGYPKTFEGPSGVATTTSLVVYTYDNLSYPVNGSVSGVPLAIALDKINTNTLWVATTNGVSRSIDFGLNWSSYAFSGGVNTNCRCILVDPNNTINVMSGSEDGLYRTTNGGSSWTRIRSGLGNYKTITSLTQAAGAAGQRRKVWVGTSGGVFIGKQSLALE